MFATMKIQPQVADTDLFGAVDYLAATRWFDRARTPIYQEIFPGFHLKQHGLVVVKITVEYFNEARVDDVVEIQTWVSRIGGRSFDITQELHKMGADGEQILCATSVAIFSTINFNEHKSEPLDERFLKILNQYSWSRYEPNAAINDVQ